MATSRTLGAPHSNTIQHSTAASGGIPQADRVADGLWSVPMEMPSSYLRYSYCYASTDAHGDIHVIDPGWDTEANWKRLTDFLASIGSDPSRIASVVVTHSHPDHAGLVDRVRRASGASFVGGAVEYATAPAPPSQEHPADLEKWGVPVERWPELAPRAGADRFMAGPTPDVLLDDGSLLEIPGRSISAMRTAGHTPGHLCFYDAEHQVMLTGDQLLPRAHPGLGLGGPSEENPIAEYLASLDRVAQLDGCEAAPGHEFRFRGVAERCASTAEHHLRRTRAIAQALETTRDLSLWELAASLHWSAGWENLRDFYLRSALLQTEMQVDFVQSGAADAYL